MRIPPIWSRMAAKYLWAATSLHHYYFLKTHVYRDTKNGWLIAGNLYLTVDRAWPELHTDWNCTLCVCVCVCVCVRANSLQLCPTLCNPMDCSPPGSSVHGILQAKILEWVAMPSSQRSSLPRDQTLCLLWLHAGSLPLALTGKPLYCL